MRFILYHHKNRELAEYIKEYTELKKYDLSSTDEVEIVALPNTNSSATFAELPQLLRELLYFAKPDLVICLDDGKKPIKPIFAIEITLHVPATDHWLQRFNNLVGCAKEGVPGAYIMPFELNQKKQFKGPIDSEFFYAYDRIMEIHKTPLYISEWESSDGEHLNSDNKYHGLPDHDSKHIQDTIKFINVVIDAAIRGIKIEDLMKERIFINLRDKIRNKAYKQIPQISSYKRLAFNMPKGEYLDNKELENLIKSKGLDLPENIPDRIIKRDKNLVFVPQVERTGKSDDELRDALNIRIKNKGGDPYLGQPLAFDYMFCRLGPTPYERDANLVIDLSVLYFEDIAGYHKNIWESCPLQYTDFKDLNHIPQYTMYLTKGCSQAIKNFLRMYSFAADIIIFRDGIIYF